MRNHFSGSFTMDQVAEVAGVSRRLLEMRFRAERNASPAEFLALLRIQKAKGMLASHNQHSAEEIARTCGFGTGKNLRAAFQRILKASPNDFRPN
jgi:transcriptional regulator GlxA family with amidase domain